jgi:hypothetical protein
MMRVLAACGISVAVGLLSGCDIEGQTMSVSLVNDSATTLSFLQCRAGDCSDIGGRSASNVVPGGTYGTVATVDTTSWYRVVDTDGQTVGCLRLAFNRREGDARVYASQVEACP